METSLLTVVAVVVTRNPGPSFEDTLASLAAQDYPALPILVLDDGSAEAVTNRVAQVVPSAFVRRFDTPIGFAAAANESLAMVQGAAYLLFCHDDVALAPDAVRLLAAEAQRSGAGLVTPKIVAWNAHDRLLSLGSNLDRIGSPIGVVETLELDQGQHDGVRDVNHAPGAAVLVRADAFRSLGGFDAGTNDPAMLRIPAELADHDPLYGPDLGEDIDLSWRMKQHGELIAVQPMARVAHLGSAHGSSGGRKAGTPSGPKTNDPRARSTTTDSRAPSSHAANADSTDPVSASSASSATSVAATSVSGTSPATFGRSTAAPATAPAPPPNAAASGPKSPTKSVAKQVLVAREANRLRTMVTTASGIRLPFVVLVLFARSLAQSLVPGRRTGSAGFAPWRLFLANIGSIRKQRKAVQKVRAVGDRELLAMLQPVGARTRATIRDEVTTEGALAWNAAERVVGGRSRLGRNVFAAFAVFGVVTVFGSRWLIRNGIPATGQFAPWPSVRGLFGAAFSEWRSTGFGVSAPAPPGTFILAGLATLFLGKAALAQTVFTLALLPLGGLGMWRLSGLCSADSALSVGDAPTTGPVPAHGPRPPGALSLGETFGDGVLSAKVVSTAAYLVAPVFYDGLVSGRFDALIAYGLLPWLVHRVLRGRTRTATSPRIRVFNEAVFVGVPFAFIVALAPTLLPLLIVLLLGWAAGSAVVATVDHAKFVVTRLAYGLIASVVLLGPWVFDLLIGSGSRPEILIGGDQAASSGLSVTDILRMSAGPVGRHVLSWVFPVLAVLPLLVADNERFRNAVRAWFVIIVTTAAYWMTGRGWLPVLIPSEHAGLVPVALAISVATGLGVAGVQRDARSRSFGWRQTFGLAASAGVLVLTVPVVLSAGSGRWNLPERTLASDLRWLNDKAADGGYRIAWLGSPRVLPSAGWRIGPDLALATSDDGLPSALSMYGARSTPALQLAIDHIREARDRKTARLGALLAPYAVRYVIVVNRPWPDGPSADVATAFRSTLLDQLDLRQIEVSDGALLFENTAWVPTYAAVPARPEAVDGAVSIDLSGSQPVLLSSRPASQLADDALVAQSDPEQALRDAETRRNDVVPGTALRGRVPPISTLTVAVSANDRWRATGGTLDSSPVTLASGTMAFVATGLSGSIGAPAVQSTSSVDVVTLEFQSPPIRRLVRAIEGLLWLVCVVTMFGSRRHDRRSRELRLLTAERLVDTEDPTAEFGASLGWDAEESDDGEPLDADPFASVPEPSGTVEAPLRSRSARGADASGHGMRAEGVGIGTLDRDTGPEGAAGLRAPVDGSGEPEASVADALWATWSRRREERDDQRH